jgi:hypothetical protein
MSNKPFTLSDLPERYRVQAEEQLRLDSARARNKELLEPPVVRTLKERKGRPEGEFQDALIAYAESLGWLVYHTFDSRRSVPGFPDLILLRGHRQVVAELKSERGRLSADQDKWQRAFLDTGCQVYIWRPGDWPEIERVLS